MTRTFIPLLICLLSYFSSVGQDQVVQTVDANGAALNSVELSEFRHIQSLGYFTEHYLLSDFTLPETFEDNTFDIQIPGIACGPLSYEIVDIAYQSENEYKVYATIQPNTYCSEFEGEMMLMATTNGKVGYLKVDSMMYEINPIGEQQLLLSKVDNAYFQNGHCALSSSETTQERFVEPGSQKAAARTPPYGYGNCKVRCLILYTSAALTREGRPTLMRKINKAQGQTEQALRNSRISKNQLSVEWLGPENVAFTETNRSDDDIDAITMDPQITGLRTSYLADLVIVLTDGNYDGVNGTVRQLGPDSARAYALVNTKHMTSGRYVFAHEFAHLFGAGHQNDLRPGIPHGHQWRSNRWLGKKRRSIMHTAGSNPKRVLHYSNPSVVAFGDRTGRRGRRDNAEVLRQGACPVATFLPEPELIPFSSYIVGDLQECLCQTAEFTIRTYGGNPGPVSTKWYTSTNGFDYTLAGEGEFFHYDLPCPFPSNQLPPGSPNKVFLKAVSTSPDGQEWTDFHRLDFLNLDEDECSFDAENHNQNNGFGIQVSPNPVGSPTLTVRPDEPLPCSNTTIKVLDTSGNLVVEEQHPAYEGQETISLNIASLEKGIYLIYLQCSNGNYSKGLTFIKL